MRQIRAIAVLPTLFTLGNLVCGFFAIVVAARIAKSGTIDFVPAPKLETARQLIGSGDPTHNLMLCGQSKKSRIRVTGSMSCSVLQIGLMRRRSADE